MDKIKYIKLENEDGTYSDNIALAVDSDYVDVNGNTLTNELANKATKTEVQAVVSGSPAGVYETVSALTTADPDHSKIYLVTTNGHWYYYNENAWIDGGVYQALGIANESIFNNNVISNGILSNKILYYDNLLLRATSVSENKVLNGYNSTTKVPIEKVDSNFDIYYFNISDFDNEIISFYKNSAISSYQMIILYKENNVAYNATSTVSDRPYLDLNGDIVSIRLNYFSGIDQFAISIRKDRPLLFINNSQTLNFKDNLKYEQNIFGKNIIGDISASNINDRMNGIDLDGITILKNRYISGSNSTTKTPNYNTSKNYSVIVINRTLVDENIFKNLYGYVDITNTNNFCTYNPGIGITTYSNETLSSCINSEGYCNINTAYKIPGAERPYIAFNISNIPTEKMFLYYKMKDYEVILPSNLKVVANNNLLLYFNNCIKNVDVNKFQLVMCNGGGINFNKCWLLNKADISNSTYYYQIFEKKLSSYSDRYSFKIQNIDSDAGNGLNKKVLFIGDSLTASNNYTKKVIDLFSNDVMHIQSLGTLGSGIYKMEGRSGWRAYTYTHCATGADEGVSGIHMGINPFYNTSTEKFDFSYYMTQQGYTDVDYVFINLGTNDLNRSPMTETDIMGYYDEMITSIKQYNSNIKICLWLPPLRGIHDNSSYILQRDRALQIHQWLIKKYDNRMSENIYLIPVYLQVSADDDYNISDIIISENTTLHNVTDLIHPKDSGYKAISEVIYYWIKYLGSLS